MTSSPLRRYLHHAKNPYALVTGSTGGMGEEWAKQLAALGFNVIIQGRNKVKLEGIRDAILASLSTPVIVKLLVSEATIYPNPNLTDSLSAILAEPDVDLVIVINNLGVVSEGYPRFEDESSEEVAGVIIANTLFPAEVTRVCLPELKKNEPSLCVVVTSLGAWAPPPYLSPYAGTKGFDVSFSRSLYNEMAAESRLVDIVCMAPGQVVSGMNEGPPSLMVPSSETWVKAGIASLKPGWFGARPKPVIIPYGPHAWGQTFVNWAPQSWTDKIAISMVKEMQVKFKESKKT